MSIPKANGTKQKGLNPAPSQQKSAEITAEIAKLSGGKPDIAHHHEQLDLIKAEIDSVTADLDDLKARLSGAAPANTPEGKRRAELYAELESIRQSQAGSKGSRGKVLDDLKSKQDALNAKVKALQASRSKSAYKSPSDVDAAIARLNAQIETGSLKLVDERRALNEISNLRKSRKAVETFTQQQESIDKDREQVEKLRQQLDDPQSRALSKRFDDVRSELDSLKAKAEKSGESRQQLLAKRGEVQAKLDDLWKKRRARQADFRTENDNFQSKVRQEREKRNEKLREEKRAEEARRRKDDEKSLREDAALPAYTKEIEDCDVLIRYFLSKTGGGIEDEASADAEKKPLEGVKPLEIRKIENGEDAFSGATIAKKKDQDEDLGYFVGASKKNKGKNKKKRGVPLSLDEESPKTSGAESAPTLKGAGFNVSLPTLSALLSLNIPPPNNQADIHRVVENLRLKKAYFVGDQKRKTQENIENVEKKLAALNASSTAEEPKEASIEASV